MKKTTLFFSFILIVISVWPALAGAPLPQELVRNGSMEAFSGSVPDQWQTWYNAINDGCQLHAPEFTAGMEGRSGKAAMWFLNYHTYEAGLKQSIQVGAGSRVRFTAYGHIISAEEIGERTSHPNAGVAMKIGIDPTGGDNPLAGHVVWSPTANAIGDYQQFTVEATAQGDSVMVFLYSRPLYCNAENSTFFDDASLTVIGQGDPDSGGEAAAPAPPPVAQSVSVISPPRPDGSIVHTVQSGETLGVIAYAYGVTVQQIKDLNGLSSSIIYTGDELLIKPPDEAAGGDAAGGDAGDGGESGEAGDSEGEAAPAEGEGGAPPPTGGESSATAAPPPQAVAAGDTEAEQTGNLCVLAFDDRNHNATRDPGEGLLAGVTAVLSDGAGVLGEYTTTGAAPNEPYCFLGLMSGNYALQFDGPTLAATSPENLILAVPAGKTVRVEHGAVSLSGQAGRVAAGTEADLPSRTQRLAYATIGAAVAVFGMTLLGGLVGALFLR